MDTVLAGRPDLWGKPVGPYTCFPAVEASVLYDLANIHLSMIEERYKPEDKAASKSGHLGFDVDSTCWKRPATL